jgi:hypothetical protein
MTGTDHSSMYLYRMSFHCFCRGNVSKRDARWQAKRVRTPLFQRSQKEVTPTSNATPNANEAPTMEVM